MSLNSNTMTSPESGEELLSSIASFSPPLSLKSEIDDFLTHIRESIVFTSELNLIPYHTSYSAPMEKSVSSEYSAW